MGCTSKQFLGDPDPFEFEHDTMLQCLSLACVHALQKSIEPFLVDPHSVIDVIGFIHFQFISQKKKREETFQDKVSKKFGTIYIYLSR